jgi:hypothetical protein
LQSFRAKNIIDVDFANDIALLPESNSNTSATEVLHRVGLSAAKIGLFINDGKTKVMTLNMNDQAGYLLSRLDFIYFGQKELSGTPRLEKTRLGRFCKCIG